MDDRVGAGERVLGLAEVGQVGHDAQPERAPVVADVDVEDIVAVVAQVAHDPRSAFAAAPGDDDAHAGPPRRAKYGASTRSGQGCPVSQSRLISDRHRPRVASNVTPRHRTPPTSTPRPVPLPRTWTIAAVDIIAVLVANGIVILAMWLRHDGLDQLSTLGGQLTAIGQLTGLYGTYFALIQLVLMSRSPWLDQVFGMDGLAVAHRWLGFATVWLLLAHGVFIITGYALGDGSNVVQEFDHAGHDLPVRPDGRRQRRAVRGRGGQLDPGRPSSAVVRDLVRPPPVRVPGRSRSASCTSCSSAPTSSTTPSRSATGSTLYLVTVAFILVFRIGQPVWLSTRHQLRVVAASSTEAPGVISIYVTGRDLDQLAVRSGQYFVWRFLTRDGWWRAHPFSISSAPNGSWLRITIKELGDWSKSLQGVSVGTQVFVEGPYGVLTGARRTRPEGRAHRGRDRHHAAASAARGAAREARRPDPPVPRPERRPRSSSGTSSTTLAQPRGARDPLPRRPARRRRRRSARRDLAGAPRARTSRDRDVYLCGPVAMMQRVEESLRRPRPAASDQVHAERFAY